ncbi:hypothetical protein Ctob_013874 [Chrysochromulina tobinii]|uniref:Protein nlrc3 n=1 Tax=Chrysochromulina tobinii TaxID=1460289 RepID=A0A0M0KAQ1_9EUKA|nr:hypothetical protein Ctob_013874 [Chrysochromulina tobinii]|eukprot:KOO35677.1 hypothetical protein Ctob_013874 [Chrysochromulina sp. CCMP291]
MIKEQNGGDPNEVWLFNGNDSMQENIKNGFMTQYASEVYNAYGVGIYFAADPRLSMYFEQAEKAAFFAKVGASLKQVRSATELKWSHKGLTDGDCKVIALLIATKFMPALSNLELYGNSIGYEGAKAIADALQSGTAVVTKLELGGNKIGDEGAKAIAEALKVNAVVTTLDLRSNSIGDEGAKAIAEALKVNAVVTTLDLGYNYIKVEGAKAIAEALKVNRVLTTLWLNGNKIGDEGTKAIADALQTGTAVLTRLYLWDNNLGDAGKTAVQDAVKGRSGFQLYLWSYTTW